MIKLKVNRLQSLSKIAVEATKKDWQGSNSPQIRIIHTTKSSAPTGAKALDFNDPKIATVIKTNTNILQSWLVFTLCQVPFLAANCIQLARLTRKLLGDKLFCLLMKMTFYGHFVGGEDDNKIQPKVALLRSFGVEPILDYASEEELSSEEAAKLEESSSVPKQLSPTEEAIVKKYRFNKKFADRRQNVVTAHIYFYKDENSCDKNMESVLQCIRAVSGHPHGQAFAAIKLTALTRPQILLQLSEIIVRGRKFLTSLMGQENIHENIILHHFSAKDLEKKFSKIEGFDEFMKRITQDKEGIIHLFPWSQLVNDQFELHEAFKFPDLKTGKMIPLIGELSPLEAASFHGLLQRIHHIAKEAVNNKVYLTIDAEHSFFQPAISRLATELMRIYNKKEPFIWNTYQCYLKDSFNEVISDLEQCRRQDFCFGAKLVRGAYMILERARAKEMKYPDPINDSYESTSAMFEKVASECLLRIREDKKQNQLGRHAIMVASHNESSVKLIVEKMDEYGIKNTDNVVCFAQLTGMCDFISFTLANARHRVYKYLPYGPVVEVMPYLARRVQENRGLIAKVQKEKRLLRQALFGRLASGQFIYTPKAKITPV